MPETRSPALTFAIDGEHLEVIRSWPGSSGERIFECRDASGRVRAARLDPGERLRVLPHGEDRKLPSLRPGGDLLVHRAGKRAVERTAAGYVKHLRRGRAAGVARATRTMGRLAAAAGFAVPEVTAEDEHSVTVSTVPGRPLLALPDAAWERAWDRWAQLWPRLAAPGAVPDGAEGEDADFGTHDAIAEAGVVSTWFAHLRAFDAGSFAGRLTAELAALEDRACAELLALTSAPARTPVIAHRDLHDGQMLYCPDTERLGILDFDTAVRADRELDLGNLDVHLDLRVAQHLLTPDRAAVARAAITRAATAVVADAQRLDVYRRAARARLVCVYAFRPQWAGLAARMAEEHANAG